MNEKPTKLIVFDLIHILYILRVRRRQTDFNSITRYIHRRIRMDVEHEDEQL